MWSNQMMDGLNQRRVSLCVAWVQVLHRGSKCLSCCTCLRSVYFPRDEAICSSMILVLSRGWIHAGIVFKGTSNVHG